MLWFNSFLVCGAFHTVKHISLPPGWGLYAAYATRLRRCEIGYIVYRGQHEYLQLFRACIGGVAIESCYRHQTCL